MRTLPVFLMLLAFFLNPNCILAADKTVQSVIITQIDTFALKGMSAQPVLKIKVNVTGTTGSLTLQRLAIQTANMNNSDVDSVALYYTKYYSRFSLADYPGEAFLVDKRKAIVGDSVVINYSLELETGENYFWVTMDLSKISRASRYLDAFIKEYGIKIGNTSYPAEDYNPSGSINIFDIYFKENFEVKNLQNEPKNWTQQQLFDSPVRWVCRNGGYGLGVGTGHPSAAKSGNLNAMLYWSNQNPYKTMLVSKPIDLSLATRPLLTFYHAQAAWSGYNDELRILYRIGDLGSWVPIDSFQMATPNAWTKRQLYLPEGITPSNLYLAFEGKTKYGWGVCIDSLCIYETQIVARSLKDLKIENPNTEDVPQGSTNNPIMRINIKVKGNTNDIYLNSLKVTSNNTSNNDIQSNGVKLYYTNDSVYFFPVQIGTAQTFLGDGTVTYAGLNRKLETGDNYFWVVYDIKASAKPGNIIDAKINAGDIGLTGVSGLIPGTNISPTGQRIVKQSLFIDDFENTTTSWTLNGEFEVAAPTGKGGNDKGFPDPVAAYSGTKVLGTDLTMNGDYVSDLSYETAYTATSPLINAKYYKNINLIFQRYLNLDFTDVAAIEYKYKDSSQWSPIWVSENRYVETDWSKKEYSNLKFLERKKFNLRFRLGPTDAIDVYSGWNIDYLFFTADSIPFDATVTNYISPNSSCGLTSKEKVTVVVKNTGPQPLVNTPIKISLDGGKTYSINEIITKTIKVDSSLVYTFNTPVDFSKPAMYSLVVKTAHPGDNYPQNDSIIASVVAFPTYKLPYITGFENDTTFWFSSGQNSSWSHGNPHGTFILPNPEGQNCWKTDDGGFHKLKEYSYLTSPCFSFSGKELPMIDLKLNYFTHQNYDGAILEYSLDQGKSWVYAKEDNYPFPWKWYNDSIYSLKHKGWTYRTLDGTGNQTWKQGRQILPAAMANKDTVMFRFVFKSDSIATLDRYEGFAFDDFKVYDAPFDIGIDTITGLSDPACQYVNSPYLNVVIKNYGYRRMTPGDTVIIGATVNGVLQAVDTMKMTSALIRNATFNYTLKKPVNFSATGKYTIKAFTRIENDKSFYGLTNNDTSSITLTVYQNPVTGLPDSIFSARIDTIDLVAIDSANYKYYWQGSGTPGTHIYTNVTDTGKYTLRVQNKTSFCETKDTVVIRALIPDVSVSQILSPKDHCGYKNAVNPVIIIRNEGTDTLRSNIVIPVKLKFGALPVLSDNIVLKRLLAPDSSYTDTLGLAINLSSPGLYSLKIYSQMPYDITKDNDTANLNLEIYGYPNIDLGAQVSLIDTSYRIIAPAGYSTYLWSNDSITRFNTVKKTGWYKVTVTDSHLCPAEDSVFVFLKIRDIKPIKLVSPANTCKNVGLSNVVVRILNAGSDTIHTNDSIYLSYIFNGGTVVLDTLKPSKEILPGDSIDFTFDKQEDLTATGTYNFNLKIQSKPVPDFYPANDSAKYLVKIYGLPNPVLEGLDNMLALQWVLDPGNGFVSYQWQDGSTDSVFIITKNHFMADRRYQVKVTDINGCSATSPWYVRNLIVYDVEVSGVDMTTDTCSLSNNELVKITIKNVGNTPIQSSKKFMLKYQLNGGAFSAVDTITLGSTYLENQVLNHTFSQKADLSQKKNHQVKIFVEFDQDINTANDTMSHWTNVYGSPVIDFGTTNDTLVVDCPHTLDAGANYMSYLWSTNQFSQTIEAIPGKYSVIVVDMNGCVGSRSVTVIEKFFDLGINGFLTATNNCSLTTNETIGVKIKNKGTASYANQPISIQYVLNGTINKTQNFAYTGAPGVETLFTFSETENLSAVNIHNFNVTLSSSLDEVTLNNTMNYNITVFGYPLITFAGAIDDTIRTNDFPHTLDAGYGFASYKWQDNSTDRYFKVAEQGLYNVTVTSYAGCSSSKWVYVKSTLSVGKLSELAKLKIYPNPASDKLWVELDLKFNDDAILEIITTDGKPVMNRLLKGYKQYFEMIDISGLPKGLYYIRIYNKEWLVTDKLLVQ